MKIQNILKSAAATGLLMMLPFGAQAGLVVEVEDLVAMTTTSVSDNGAGDGNPLAGFLTATVNTPSASFNFIANSGAPTGWFLSDTQINAVFGAGGAWRVSVFEDAYAANTDLAFFNTAISPTLLPASVTATVETYVNGVLTFSSDPLAQLVNQQGGGFAALTAGTDFTIEHRYNIVATAGGTVSYDTATQGVPEPEALGLLGFALMGLALVRRKYQAV